MSDSSPSAEASALLHDGRLREAREAFARAEPDDPGSAAWRRSLDTWFELLERRWRPPPLPDMRGERVPGRPLHLVGAALPDVQNGYTIRTRGVTDGQRAAGLDPHLFIRSSTSPSAELGEQLAGQTLEAAGTVERLRPAVLHPASDFVNARLALALREASGIPVVYEVRGLWEESWFAGAEPRREGDELYELRRAAEIECMLAADRVVTLSETMRTELAAAGAAADRVAVVPNGVHPEAFTGPRPRGGGELVVGYVGTVAPYEGLGCLLEAIALLRDRGRPLRGLVVGDGGRELERLRALADELGIAERVSFPGVVPHTQVAECYRRIDVFAVPRRDDPVCRIVPPVKPVEAMAAGCAIVVSDLPALREIVRPGETGLAVPPGDASALADAIEGLAADPAHRQALAAAGREWARAERTWAGAGERCRELYSELGAI